MRAEVPEPVRSVRPSTDTVRYLVVVHGIGQQKKNETVLPVIYRMAEARAAATQHFGSPITRGVMASQLREAPAGEPSSGLEEGWVEFEGIPQDPEARRYAPFIGRASERPGTNLRFVDLHWANIMDGLFDTFGESTAVWTRALIDRLANREAPSWILESLHALREGVIPLQKFLSKRLPGLSEEIFSRFLGDVQLYGEYLPTRGMAVRRFHQRLARIEQLHYEQEAQRSGSPRAPRYTVIAHSLGSIMSFDALTFAHARPPEASEAARTRLLQLLPEYDRDPSTGETDADSEGESLPDLGWVRNVEALVTLGSPIDKFLILWWLNYEHLTTPHDDWLDPSRRRDQTDRILHYNYCDSNDPVGGELDVAYSEGIVTHTLFDKVEDKVFSRYAGPGAAHTDYWSDGELFRRILDLAVDGTTRRKPHEVRWFRWGAYLWGLFWSYLAIPFAGWLAGSAVLIWTFGRTESWLARSSGVLLGLGILGATCWLLGLMIRWRAAVGQKEESPADALEPSEKKLRARLRNGFHLLLCSLPIVWLYLLLTAQGLRWPDRFWPGEALLVPWRWLTARLPTPAKTIAELLDRSWPAEWLLGPVRWLAHQLLAATEWLAKLSARSAPLPEEEWILNAAVSVFALGFTLASWRLFVWLRVWWRWRRVRRSKGGEGPSLDFRRYLDTDPTRAATFEPESPE